MRHGLSKKKEKEKKKRKMACPRSMTQKKRRKKWTHQGPKKKEIYNNIAMPSCYPNKGERDS